MEDAPPEDRAAPPREAAEAVAPADHASPSATAPAGEAAEALVAADHVATVATAPAEEAAQPPVAADHASPETAEALVAADHVATVATAPAEKAAQPPVAADHASPEAAEALAAADHVATVATAPAEEAAQPPVAADHVALCATAAPVEAAEAAPSAAAPCFLASQFRSLYDRLQSLSYMRYEGPRSALEFFSSFFLAGGPRDTNNFRFRQKAESRLLCNDIASLHLCCRFVVVWRQILCILQSQSRWLNFLTCAFYVKGKMQGIDGATPFQTGSLRHVCP